MNNTTKAKYDMAEKMLKVDISLEEVALMTELPMETLKKIQHDIQKDGLFVGGLLVCADSCGYCTYLLRPDQTIHRLR